MFDRKSKNSSIDEQEPAVNLPDYNKMYEQYKDRLEIQQDFEEKPFRRTNRKEVEAVNQRLIDINNQALQQENQYQYEEQGFKHRSASIQNGDKFTGYEQMLPVLGQFKNRKIQLATMPVYNREEMTYQEMMQYKLKSIQYRKSPKLDAMTRRFKMQCQNKPKLPSLHENKVNDIPDDELNYGDNVGRAISRKGRMSRNFRRSGLKNVYTEQGNNQ